MKIAIVGAGWYGCHLGLSLKQSGAEVKIFERSNKSISSASRKNQNRLHLGFHYPRDNETRIQSKEGYNWFVEHYGHLTEKIHNNVYAVAKGDSLIDYETYKLIMSGAGLSYQEMPVGSLKDIKLENVSKLIRTDERLIKNFLASDFFDSVLKDELNFNKHIDLSNEAVLQELKKEYDYVIDCTWGTTRKIKGLDYFYEPCIYFYYKKLVQSSFALTLMDGNLFSLYPYHNDIYTLTSVEHTPIGQTESVSDISQIFETAKSPQYIKNKKRLFETGFSYFYPKFLEQFKFEGVEFSLKTKIKSNSDFRGCVVVQEGNLISVFSGKIDTLHIAEEEVFRILNES
ncbi:MAG: hypothetical protein WBC60_17380 [Cognaticolwellia sp.]